MDHFSRYSTNVPFSIFHPLKHGGCGPEVEPSSRTKALPGNQFFSVFHPLCVRVRMTHNRLRMRILWVPVWVSDCSGSMNLLSERTGFCTNQPGNGSFAVRRSRAGQYASSRTFRKGAFSSFTAV